MNNFLCGPNKNFQIFFTFSSQFSYIQLPIQKNRDRKIENEKNQA